MDEILLYLIYVEKIGTSWNYKAELFIFTLI